MIEVETGREEGGSVVVEFGLMFPLIVLLISGMITFGLAYEIQLTLQQASREGVRVYALGSGDPVVAATDAAPNLTGMGVITSANCDPATPGDPAPQAWVQTSYDFDLWFVPDFSLFGTSVFDDMSPLSLTSRAVMRCGG